MRNNKSKFVILATFSALALAVLAGCSGDKEESESSFDEALLRQPITFSYGSDNFDDESSSGNDLDAQDPTASEDSSSQADSSTSSDDTEDATEYIAVTEADGEPVTTYVVVTDASGQPVTDSNGQTQTTAVQVTTAVKVTNPSGNSNQTQTTTSSSGGSSSDYVSRTDSAYALWMDISKDEDFMFEDEFIQVTFKIKENIPDGVYDVIISDPDFASLADNVKTVYPDTVLNGKVYVSQEAVPQREITDADGFTVYADNVSAKQGEEVTLTFSMKKNPGLCAINFWFDYDRNAMEIVNCEAVGTFADIASSTAFGEPIVSNAQ